MNKLMREEFEKWAISQGYSVDWTDDTVGYSHSTTWYAYQGWQAAKDLPNKDLVDK